MPAKLLVLAIDAASPDLLEQWAADGTLPNLRALMARGLVGRTENVDGFCIGSTWPSWYTGVTPARHGLHYLLQLRPGTYALYRPGDEGLVKRDAFWSHFSRAGHRVAVLDVPVSAIDRSLNGVQTVEWGGHDAIFGLQTHPTELAPRIVSKFGVHPLATPCDEIGRTASGYRSFVANLISGVHLKTQWTLDLLTEDNWDFFVQVFTEAHCAGHQCWHLHDRAHPGHDTLMGAEIGDPLRTIYQAIDAGIGRIVEAAGDVPILILSLHGMSHAFGAQFLLRDLLIRLGVTQPLPTAAPASGVGASAGNVLRAVWRRLPSSFRDRMAPVRDRWHHRQAGSIQPRLDVDAARSWCFVHQNGLATGGIRLNLAGREPSGIVERAQAENFEDNLARDLLAIVDEHSGRPLIRSVRRTRDLYSGEHLNLLPDLLVDWDDAAARGSTLIGNGKGATVRAASPKIASVVGANDYGRTGEHRPEGLFIAAGPNAPSGRLSTAVSILDFAPTFAKLLDVALPESDGVVQSALIEAWR